MIVHIEHRSRESCCFCWLLCWISCWIMGSEAKIGSRKKLRRSWEVEGKKMALSLREMRLKEVQARVRSSFVVSFACSRHVAAC